MAVLRRTTGILAALLAALVLASIRPAGEAAAVRVEIDATSHLRVDVVGPAPRSLMAPVHLPTHLHRLDDAGAPLRRMSADEPRLPLQILVADPVPWRWCVHVLELAADAGYAEAMLLRADGARVRIPTTRVSSSVARVLQTLVVRVTRAGDNTVLGFDDALTSAQLERGVQQEAHFVGTIRPGAGARAALDALIRVVDDGRARAASEERPFRLGLALGRAPITVDQPRRGIWLVRYGVAHEVLALLVGARWDGFALVQDP